jgi:DNA-binding transcriptional ArsR family regulator
MWVGGDSDVVAIARAFSHRLCIRLVDELASGEAAVSDLSVRLGEPQPSISSHLALLRNCGLVDVDPRGRQRAYRLRGRAPALAVATLRTLAAAGRAPDRSSEAERAARMEPQLREARTCYDHLAGLAGVRLLDSLLDRGWLESEEASGYRLTAAGAPALERAGVDLQSARQARRAFAIGCPDWTERRPHLGGALGAALLDAMLAQGRVRLKAGSRSLDIDLQEPHRFLAAADV